MEDDGIRRIVAVDFDVLAGGKYPLEGVKSRGVAKMVDSMAPQVGIRLIIFSDRPIEQEPGIRDWLNNYVTAFFSGDAELLMFQDIRGGRAAWIESMGVAAQFLMAVQSAQAPRADFLEAGIPVFVLEEPKKEAPRGQAKK